MYGCVCVCVYRFISGSIRDRFYPDGSYFFFFFFYSEFEKKIIYDSLIRFCFMSNF